MKSILLALLVFIGSQASAVEKSMCKISYDTLTESDDSDADVIFYYQVAKRDQLTNEYVVIHQQECDEVDKISDVIKDNCNLILLEGVFVEPSTDGLKLSLSCG